MSSFMQGRYFLYCYPEDVFTRAHADSAPMDVVYPAQRMDNNNNEAQAGALAQEAINLFTQGMGQQKKAEEKAEKAVMTSAPVKDAREKLERTVTDKARSAVKPMADKMEQYAKDYTIKFRKKKTPAKNAPGRGEGDAAMIKREWLNPNIHNGQGLNKDIDQAVQKAVEAGVKAAETGVKAAEAAPKTAGAAARGTEPTAFAPTTPVSKPIIMGTQTVPAGVKSAENTMHKAVETGREATKKIQETAKTATKGAELAEKAVSIATSPAVTTVVAGTKVAATGLSAATGAQGLNAALKAPADLRKAGTKALDNLLNGSDKKNKEVQPVISAKDAGKDIARNVLTK